ncbi:S8/S53 family peptidase [Verrucomicrobiaceae bacterium 227]
MKRISLILFSFLALVAFADLPNLPPGGSVDTNGTTFAACPEVGGTIIRDQLIPFEVRHPTLNTVLMTGRVQDRVIRNSAGRMVFSSQLRDLANPNGTAWVSQVRYYGFEGLTLGVEYRTDGSGQIGPRSISRSADGDRLTANHGVDLIVPPDGQRALSFLSTETAFDVGGRVEIIVNNDFGGGSFMTTVYGTASRKVSAVNLPTPEEVRPALPRVILNDTVYQDGAAVTAEVHFTDVSQIDQKRLALVFGGPEGVDGNAPPELEMVRLVATNDPLVYVSETSLTVQESAEPVQGDGKVSLEPGELFVAMLSYLYYSPQQVGYELFASDWGTLIDDNPAVAKVELREGLALSEDELNPVAGGKPMGTLFFEGDVGPVQVASRELLFFPRDQAQFDEFLARTQGTVSGFEGHPGGPITPQTKLPEAGKAWFVVSMTGDPAKISRLPQLRALVGEQSTLSVSNPETLALVASAMELWSEGFLVGLNPRMQLHGSLYGPEHESGSGRADSFGLISGEGPNSLPLRDERHGLRQSWAFLKMFDFDERAIPVGVIDSGFAANPDFKTGHPLYSERNLSNDTSGPGSAQTPQEVGNSGFGGKTWHGNGTVTTISGVLGNRFGTAGVAAPTAVPKLYHMGLANFALGFGSAIQFAVNDGCSVINISAGYPCRILSVLGNDDICSPGGRAAFSLKLGLAFRSAALAACAAGGLLDAFLPGLGGAVCASAIVAAEASSALLFSSVFLGSTRGPVERGVAYATERGVPIVASAGNRLSAAALGALAPFVNYENSNIDDWQVIPAVIPDVIAVGACYPTDENRWNGFERNFYANLQFWGESVDIWAPIYTHYWAPEPGEVDPSTIPVEDQIRREFGGTSCAAPFITGVIANMMAVDPSLDRRFSAPATHRGIPGRVRDLLVMHAYQAGDPEAPDSADDRTLFEENPDTGVFDEIEMPASLVTELQRRRNYVNAWRTLRELARSTGLLEYESLGYHVDLGRNDAYFDGGAPDGVLEPVLSNFSSLLDELGDPDREFFYRKMPFSNLLYRTHFNVTLPLRENRDEFFINGVRGSLVSTSSDEQILSWESGEYWRNEMVPTIISGSDTLYKVSTSLSNRPVPAADAYDSGFESNNRIEDAAPQSGWVPVAPGGGLEAEAWELCLEDLNIHRETDLDFFSIDFTSELGVPFTCTGMDPWITISIEPRNPAATIRAYSRAGGETVLLKVGSGCREIRLDCREYQGRLPLFVEVQGSSYFEYDLKIRWSKPDAGLRDRLNRIREANGDGRSIPAIEEFLPPLIPRLIGLHGEFGAIPDELVNPNPVARQPVDAQGRFLFSRLLEVNVPADKGFNGVLAQIPFGQSLRMELVTPFGQVVSSIGTPDHGFPDNPKAINGQVHSLSLEFPDVAAGVYLLSLSGHRTGDQITLFPSRSLLGKASGISMEDIANGIAGGAPAFLPHLTEFGGNAQFTSLRPAFAPGFLDLKQTPSFHFVAEKAELYQIELQGSDGIWRPYETPLLGDGEQATVVIDAMEDFEQVRVTQLGSEKGVATTAGPLNHQLLYQTVPGVPAGLRWSANLESGSWQPSGNEGSFVGDGNLRNWFFDFTEGSGKGFFRIEED